MYLRRNDIVLITRGKDRLKRGKILRVDRTAGRILVEGVNIVKRHKKAVGNVPGGIIPSEATISASNVRLLERPETQGMSAGTLPARVLKRMKIVAASAQKSPSKKK